MCFFPSHTTITLQQVHSLPSQTTRKFSLYFVNKLCWNNTNLGIGGSMAPSYFAKTTQQSPPSIQQAYITLYITGSFHTLHSVYFEFPHTITNLSIGGSMAAIDHSNHVCPWPDSTKLVAVDTHADTCNRTSDSAYIQPKSTT